MSVQILVGDCLTLLRGLPAESVHCVVTSPPYWGLRSYKGDPGMIGLEPTFEGHLSSLVMVFREVRRVLRTDGTCWLNTGDFYRDKKLFQYPARVALALDADGWWIRSEIVWHKPNPMPESCTDRPTSAHEKLYLLSKSARYFYDSEAVRVPTTGRTRPAGGQMSHENKPSWANGAIPEQANLRNVWTIPTHSFREAHFATFPPRLVEPCIKAGTSERGVCKQCGGPWVREVDTPENTTHFRSGTDINKGKFITGGQKQHDEYVRPKTTGWRPTCQCKPQTSVPATVLDPFAGSGTVALVAQRMNRDAILCEISPEYAEMARKRIEGDAPMFADVVID